MYQFTSENQADHTFWQIQDINIINKIQKIFENIERLYIADGHHRCAAGLSLYKKRKESNPLHFGKEPYNFFLSVLFPHNHLKILPYHRIVKDIDISPEQFSQKVSDDFDFAPTQTKFPQNKT